MAPGQTALPTLSALYLGDRVQQVIAKDHIPKAPVAFYCHHRQLDLKVRLTLFPY